MKRLHITNTYHMVLCGLSIKKAERVIPLLSYTHYPRIEHWAAMADTYEWCPDCVNHPNVTMFVLNKTSV